MLLTPPAGLIDLVEEAEQATERAGSSPVRYDVVTIFPRVPGTAEAVPAG